eukprot:TRINITY_DN60207_c0_g1_i1.p1 TRINITY_DN60207_c0_g1~~TRINITY_DN60207_c0_g1_i1.p1  ORF type:complete len:170 (-),score=48.56 TRINITY_DN60207_c0_g1_i1:524-1033(-)
MTLFYIYILYHYNLYDGIMFFYFFFFFFQAEDGIRDAQESRGLGDVYKRQGVFSLTGVTVAERAKPRPNARAAKVALREDDGSWLEELEKMHNNVSNVTMSTDRSAESFFEEARECERLTMSTSGRAEACAEADQRRRVRRYLARKQAANKPRYTKPAKERCRVTALSP